MTKIKFFVCCGEMLAVTFFFITRFGTTTTTKMHIHSMDFDGLQEDDGNFSPADNQAQTNGHASTQYISSGVCARCDERFN